MEPYQKNLVLGAVLVAVIWGVTFSISRLFQINRTKKLKRLMPDGWRYMGHEDEALRETLRRFPWFADRRGLYQTKDIFTTADDESSSYLFEYRYTVNDGEGPSEERQSAFLCESPAFNAELEIDYQPFSNLLKSEGVINVTRKYVLKSEIAEPLQPQTIAVLADHLNAFDDKCRIEVLPGAALITYQDYRILGKGIPGSLEQWLTRLARLTVLPQYKRAEVEDVWPFQRASSAIAETLLQNGWAQESDR